MEIEERVEGDVESDECSVQVASGISYKQRVAYVVAHELAHQVR